MKRSSGQPHPISPLEGEMPGRAEGGNASRQHHQRLTPPSPENRCVRPCAGRPVPSTSTAPC
ncbi:hypothetical protein C0075_08835 [Rhizobium sp. KAs_5_22]|nr:hypothetical protein C0075_08835 [Rhizobium sp. KAs_5_22]